MSSWLVGQMPVEHIEAQRGHYVEVLFHLLLAEEMAALVEHESAPCVARPVVDAACPDCASGRPRELQQRLAGVEQSGFRRSPERDAVGSHVEHIGFVGHPETFVEAQADDASAFFLLFRRSLAEFLQLLLEPCGNSVGISAAGDDSDS